MLVVHILWTLLALNLLVLAHEGGHYLAARNAGIKIYEFSIGFGPRLFGWRKNDIDYSVRALFLGGFVRMAGVEETIEGGKDDEQLADDDPSNFKNKSLWARVAVLFAGPFSNYVVAFILFAVAYAFFGVPYDIVDEQAKVGYVIAKSPAYQSGLAVGDKIVAIDGQPIENWDAMTAIIRQNPEKKLTLTISRNGQNLSIDIIPRQAFGQTEPYGEIGVQREISLKRLGFVDSIKTAGRQVWYLNVATVQVLTGKVKADFMGPVGLVSEVGQATQKGAGWFLQIIAAVSGSLAFFNLIPIPLPLLDGGWIMILIIEKILRREFSQNQKAIAQMIGLAAVLVLFVVVTWGDISGLLQRYF